MSWYKRIAGGVVEITVYMGAFAAIVGVSVSVFVALGVRTMARGNPVKKSARA